MSSPKPDLQCHYMSGLEMSLYHMDIHTYKWMVYSLVIIQPATEVGQGCKSLAPIVQYNTHSLTHRHHFIVSLSEQACMLRPQRLCKSCVHCPSPVEGSGPAILITTRDCSLAALCTTTTVYCCRFSRVWGATWLLKLIKAQSTPSYWCKTCIQWLGWLANPLKHLQ